jgi:ribosome-binding ATPase YchF (GTP1/OBG family)
MNIRMTDAIVHVVRCFIDDDIIHVDGNVDPLRDVEVISLELILADLSQIEKRLEKVYMYICLSIYVYFYMHV